MIDHEDFRFGSARWATEADMARAGLFKRFGFPFGFWVNRHMRRRLHLASDGHWLVIGGAGSGKARDILGPLLMQAGGERLFVMDPRGELAAISIHNFVRWRVFAYCFNPCGLHGLPRDRVNPLDILKLDDPRLHSDAEFIAEALVPLSGSASGRHFELLARAIIRCIMKVLVESVGYVSFPSLYRSVNAIEADPDYRDALLEAMAVSAFEDVQACGAQIAQKMVEVPKEFSGIMGTIHNHLSFLADPLLRESLEQPDFSLADFTDTAQSISLFVNIPIEYVGIWSPLLRTMFTVASLYKQRAPSSPRVTMIVDEAGQLGRFEELMRGFSFGRGAGLRMIAIFQDLSQITRNYDAQAVQGFFGNAQLRMFLGTRDPHTAGFVSNMAGSETLSFNDTLAQQGARRQQLEAMRGYLNGADPFAAAFDVAHYGQAARNRTKMPRALITPDEVLSLPEREMIVFLSGLDMPPMRISKLPYWEQIDLNGFWLPNPYHPPLDRVRLRGRWFDKWAEVVTENVPEHLAQYPQHQSGRVSYVAGHRLW